MQIFSATLSHIREHFSARKAGSATDRSRGSQTQSDTIAPVSKSVGKDPMLSDVFKLGELRATLASDTAIVAKEAPLQRERYERQLNSARYQAALKRHQAALASGNPNSLPPIPPQIQTSPALRQAQRRNYVRFICAAEFTNPLQRDSSTISLRQTLDSSSQKGEAGHENQSPRIVRDLSEESVNSARSTQAALEKGKAAVQMTKLPTRNPHAAESSSGSN